MEPENTKVQAPETSVAVPDMEVPKRDATDESSHPSVEEHPAKKARLDEPSKPARVDMRDRGIAPVKAEYVWLSLIYREILTLAI
jgi:tRNA-dihydrouridine synthase 3